MRILKYTALLLQLFLLTACGEEEHDNNVSYLNGFIDYLNNLTSKRYHYEDGTLLSVHDAADNTHNIEVELHASDIGYPQYRHMFKCTATIVVHDNGLTVQDDAYNCQQLPAPAPAVTEQVFEQRTIQDNEVLPSDERTVEEEDVEVRQRKPAAPCIGCSTNVDVHAPGVDDLSDLGIKHLNKHDPNVKHTLEDVLGVERQVQVVNGVRYILTLLIRFDNSPCDVKNSESCVTSKVCKISILEKPWTKLPDGSKYRGILSNNCTEEWLFGDEGEVMTKDDTPHNTDADGLIKVINNELHAQQNNEKKFTDEQLKDLEKQIITNRQFEFSTIPSHETITEENTLHIKEHVLGEETIQPSNIKEENKQPVQIQDPSGTLPEDKKKAIDDLMLFFDYSGTSPSTEKNEIKSRAKRNYDNNDDIQVLSLVKKYKSVVKSVKNAKYIYGQAQKMVDYINDKDPLIKSRVLDSISSITQEYKNDRRMLNIKFYVIIPCDKNHCQNDDNEIKTCSGTIDDLKNIKAVCINEGDNSNQINRIKRSVTGGQTEQDVNDPKYQTLAEESLKQYLLSSGTTQHHKVVSIEKVTIQVVAGSLTRIDFSIMQTTCSISANGEASSSDCQPFEDAVKIKCHSEIWDRPWLNKKEISVNCEDSNRNKRSVPLITGGQTEQDVNDPKYQTLAEESLKQYLLSSGTTQHHKVVSIEKVTIQVVAGSLTRIDFSIMQTTCSISANGEASSSDCQPFEDAVKIKCHSEIWDRPWLNKKEISVNCEDSNRNKRSVPLITGGQTEQDVNDPKYQTLAEESLKQYLLSSGTTQHHKVVSIEKVTEQVVAGSLTRIDFSILPTTCSISANGEASSSECEFLDGSFETKCHSEIWDRPWLNKKEINVNCEDSNRNKRSVPLITGGQTEQDVNDPKYQTLAEESLKQYLLSSGTTQHHKVVSIEKVTVQVVAGSLTRIDFSIMQTTCSISANGEASSSDCQPFKDAVRIKCHSKIWDRPWLNKKEISVNCEDSNRNKRSVPLITGGQTEQDVNDPKYQTLAEESLKQYLLSSGTTQHHKVVSIEKVTEQVVAGSLTRIDFSILPTTCSISANGEASSSECEFLDGSFETKCHSEIWDRPWLKKKEININCEQNDTRRKRSAFLGGEKTQNVNDARYISLAKESLHRYLLTRESSESSYDIVKIIKVTFQVVAGTMTRIDFDISPTNCLTEENGEKSTKDCKILPNAIVKRCHSKIWDRPWLNKKEINVNCEDSNRNKRSVPLITGGQTEQDVNDPKYQTLAEESLKQYLLSSGTTQHHKVVSIEKVTIQVVAGSLTRIDFSIMQTTCSISANGEASSSDCQPFEDAVKIKCHSEIWDRPWLNKKEISVNCEDSNRNKRSVPLITGGQTEQDVNDPKYQTLAEESLKQYLLSSGTTQHHKVVSIEKVTEQVVAGSLTRIDFSILPTTCSISANGEASSSECEFLDGSFETKCHSEIWDRPWLNKKEINVNCEDSNRNKRSVPLITGGQTEQDVNDPKYQTLAEESLKQYLLSSGTTQHHKVVSIEKVTVQVVAGSLTRIDFSIMQTTCSISANGEASSSDCQPFEDAVKIKCHSKIWDRPWLNKKEISVNCEDSNRNKRSVPLIVGGQTEQDVNDPKYQTLAEESLKQYLLSSGTTQHHKVVSIEKVTVQVVAGSLTRIDFSIMQTTCSISANGEASSSDCQPFKDAVRIKCHSKIWDRPWLNKKEISVNCEDSNRNKRSVPLITGGQTEQDVNDPKYQTLAEESLKQYLLSSGTTQHHKVVSIEKVTVQVVAGSLTRIDFSIMQTTCSISANGEASSSDCQPFKDAVRIKCHSKIWDRPWLNKKEISVNCEDSNRNKRSVPLITGGQTEQDVNDPKYQTLAEESLKQYLLSSGTTQHHKVVSIEKVTEQVVAGSLTRIDFSILPTTCSISANGEASSSECEILDGSFETKCHSEIWDRPWLKKKEININCEQNDTRRKRSAFLGGEKTQNVNDARYISLAKESLHRYLLTRESSESSYDIVKIIKVTFQVVAGTMTRIDFDISPTNCLTEENGEKSTKDCKILPNAIVKRCHSKIWDRPWLKLKLFEVKCVKLPETKNKYKGMYKLREKRQVSVIGLKKQDEDYIDEDTRFHYAEYAVQYMNKHTDTHNLQKLISIHAVQNTLQMNAPVIRMYIETAYTYCLKYEEEAANLNACDEIENLNHRLCLARLWPLPDDEMVVRKVNVICNDDADFERVSGFSTLDLIRASINEIEMSPEVKYKLVHQGEPNIIPSLDTKIPIKMSFVVASTNCTKNTDIDKKKFDCFIDPVRTAKSCRSFIWLFPNTKKIKKISVVCKPPQELRKRRAVISNSTDVDITILNLVQESLDKLEMSSLHKYKQKVIKINDYSTKILSGKFTTIHFDVGYTSCMKYEWVDNITNCELLEHLPKRRCVSNVWERLWLANGKEIEVNCVDYESPFDTQVESVGINNAQELANDALKHIEAKYPNYRKQKVVRIFSMEKQVVAGIHYKMKLEIGSTNCTALSVREDCELVNNVDLHKFCRVNVWLRPWSDHPPHFRVSCDYQENTGTELYHHMQAEQLFYDFIAAYRPAYVNDHDQMLHRFEIFRENVKKIHEFNVHEKGTARYAITKFADLSYEEFSNKFLGLKTSLRDPNQIPTSKAQIPNINVPPSFDWRDKGAVTNVKDQGSCGSCWAFSVTGNIEGQWKLKTGQLVSLSEQELVDCDKLDEGCNGGLPDNAYRAIEQLGGLETEADYPYEAADDKCTFNKSMSRVQITGAVNITSNETDMVKWLVKNGPISIAINANAMQFYVGGVSHPWKFLCNPTNLDHGVLIVGYGEKDYPLFHKHLPYWTIKNSWGSSWGEQGYYRVYRGDGTCGLNQMASSSVI